MSICSSAVLTYHSLDSSGSVISVRPEIFRSQMESLASAGIPVVPLREVTERAGSVAITFDDGFRNLAEHAFPLLERLGFPATVFVVSRYAGGQNDWPSQPRGRVPLLPLLGWDELRALPAAIEIGAHTATHPNLAEISVAQCQAEISGCQREIADRLGRTATSLAYPYGGVSRSVAALASACFERAAGTRFEFLPPSPGRFDLPRLDMFYFRERASLAGVFGMPSRLYVGLRNAARLVRARLHSDHARAAA